MHKILNVRTSRELAFINGQPLYDSATKVIQSILGSDAFAKLHISDVADKGYSTAELMATTTTSAQYSSEHGSFSLCIKEATKLGICSRFFYKFDKDT